MRSRRLVVILICVLVAELAFALRGVVRERTGTAFSASAPDDTLVAPRHRISANSTNDEVLEAAVDDIRRIGDPDQRALYLASAASLGMYWNQDRAYELAADAAATLEEARARVPKAVNEDDCGATAERAVRSAERTMTLQALTRVDAKLALATAERVTEDPKELDSVRIMAATAAFETDRKWSEQQLDKVDDPGWRAMAVLASITTGLQPDKMSRAAIWGVVEPALPEVRRLKDAGQRAQMLTALGALARRTGRSEVWDGELEPEVMTAVSSIKYAYDRAGAYSDCLGIALDLDPTLVPELLARGKQDIEASEAAGDLRTSLLIQVMHKADPLGTLGLVDKLSTPRLKALQLTILLMDLPDGESDARVKGTDMALSLLNEPGSSELSSSTIRGLLGGIAELHPEDAMAIARREGRRLGEEQRFRAAVLAGAARTHPDWALSGVYSLDDPMSRVQVMMAALRSRTAMSGESATGLGKAGVRGRVAGAQ